MGVLDSKKTWRRSQRCAFDELQPGDKITIDGPYGHAYLRAESERDIMCIAGGSGISPVLSIARGVLMNPDMADRQIHFYFGGRTPMTFAGSRN